MGDIYPNKFISKIDVVLTYQKFQEIRFCKIEPYRHRESSETFNNVLIESTKMPN
jgi:hypothetical protein